jgi:hypothetical protein
MGRRGQPWHKAKQKQRQHLRTALVKFGQLFPGILTTLLKAMESQ